MRSPALPCTAGAVDGDARTAIDRVPILECVAAGVDVRMSCDVPQQHAEHWAEVSGAILGWLNAALRGGDARQVATATRWFFARSAILLRTVRGGRRGRAQLAARFDAFKSGCYAWLVEDWRADVARSRARGVTRTSNESATQEAVRLIRDLEPARAIDRLLSLGLGDFGDPAVRAQAERKHPQRRRDVRPEWRDYLRHRDANAPGPARVEVDISEALRSLRRRKGAGVSGLRNEHLSALARDFPENPDAARGELEYADFASRLANAELPPYFYALLAINRLVMPVKKRPADGATPDCRPVGVPQPDRCCVERAVAKTVEAAHAKYLAPEQLGVGVKGGIALLVHGLRLLLEVHPEFVFVSLDTRNAHNEFDRESCLAAYAALLEEDGEEPSHSSWPRCCRTCTRTSRPRRSCRRARATRAGCARRAARAGHRARRSHPPSTA